MSILLNSRGLGSDLSALENAERIGNCSAIHIGSGSGACPGIGLRPSGRSTFLVEAALKMTWLNLKQCSVR